MVGRQHIPTHNICQTFGEGLGQILLPAYAFNRSDSVSCLFGIGKKSVMEALVVKRIWQRSEWEKCIKHHSNLKELTVRLANSTAAASSLCKHLPSACQTCRLAEKDLALLTHRRTMSSIPKWTCMAYWGWQTRGCMQPELSPLHTPLPFPQWGILKPMGVYLSW